MKTLFEQHGSATSVDFVDGQDFGFVRIDDDSEAYRAVKALHGAECGGRALDVTIARAYGSRKRQG